MIAHLIAAASIVSFSGHPADSPIPLDSGPPAPVAIWVGKPDLSDPSKVTVDFTVDNPGNSQTFTVPGFDPAWGVCTGVYAGLDILCEWTGGVEYRDTDFYYPGKCIIGAQVWHDRASLQTASPELWWKVHANLLLPGEYHPVAYTEATGAPGYCYNDAGQFPHTPSDGVVDYGGVSGGVHQVADYPSELDYGEPLVLPVTVGSVRVNVSCAPHISYRIVLIGYTQLTIYSYPTIYGQIVYTR